MDGNFDNPFSAFDRHQELEELKHYKPYRPNRYPTILHLKHKYIFFSRMPTSSSKTDHMLGPKAKLYKLKSIEPGDLSYYIELVILKCLMYPLFSPCSVL